MNKFDPSRSGHVNGAIAAGLMGLCQIAPCQLLTKPPTMGSFPGNGSLAALCRGG